MPWCLVVSDLVVLRSHHGVCVHLDGDWHTGGAFGHVCSVRRGGIGGAARDRCHSEILESQLLDEDANNDGHTISLRIQLVWRYRHLCEWVEDGPVHKIRTYDSDYSEFFWLDWMQVHPDDWHRVSYPIPWTTWSALKSKAHCMDALAPLSNSLFRFAVAYLHGKDLSKPESCCLSYAHRPSSWHSFRFDMLERWHSSISVSNFSYCRHSVLTILDIADSLIY